MKKRSKIASALVGLIGLVVLVAAGYVYVLARAKVGFGGATPGTKVLGTVSAVDQRAMDPGCTGVVVTPKSTWLIGRREGELRRFEFAQNVPDLSALIYGQESFNQQLESVITFVSRLDDHGRFQLIAVVPSHACLKATPDGSRVYLFTGLDHPDKAAAKERLQTAVLQSDDQGESWLWLKKGFFPEADFIAWSIDATFYGSAAWVWPSVDGATPGDGIPAGALPRFDLQYSSDHGNSIEHIATSEPILVSLEQAQKRVIETVQWGDGNGSFGKIKNFVAQLSEDSAVFWVSQHFSYGAPGALYYDRQVLVTTYAALQRENNRWQMGKVHRVYDFALNAVHDNGAGQIVGVVTKPSAYYVALLDSRSLEWKLQGEIPSVFSPLNSWSTAELYVTQHALVAKTWSKHFVPKWINPWAERPSGISGEAVFYSTDWGRTWTRLSMEAYLGLMGVDAEHDRVVWARGNWYNSQDKQVYSYDLR